MNTVNDTQDGLKSRISITAGERSVACGQGSSRENPRTRTRTFAYILFIILMYATLAPITAFAAKGDLITAGILKYNVLTETPTGGTVAVGDNRDLRADNLVIPETIEHGGKTYDMVAIADNAFKGENYVIDDDGNNVRYINSRLTGTLTLPGSLTSIGDNAFSGCIGLTGSLDIPDGVTTIGDNAFNWCAFTGTLTLPGSLVSVGDNAFSGCFRLTGSLDIPDGVTTIGDNAFYGCPFTGALTLPGNLASIGDGAFYVSRFDPVTFSRANPPAMGRFLLASAPTVIVPDGILDAYIAALSGKLGYGAIQTVSGEIPAAGGGGGVTQFTADNLVYLITDNANKRVAVAGHKDGTAASGNLSIPASVSYEGQTYAVTAIGDWAFYNCTGLTEWLSLPNSLTTIGDYAFMDCNLSNPLTLPSGLTTIGRGAFHNCNFTGSLTLPNTLTSIGDNAFGLCDGFTGDLTIPASVTHIGKNAFAYCTGLNEALVVKGSSMANIGNNAFGNTDFSGATFEGLAPPAAVGTRIFSPGALSVIYVNAVNLQSWKDRLAGKVGGAVIEGISVGSALGTFTADGLTYEVTRAGMTVKVTGRTAAATIAGAVNIPATVTNGTTTYTVTGVGKEAFKNHTGINALTLPSDLLFIDASAFQNCTGLEGKRLELPATVNTIGEEAFNGCRFSAVVCTALSPSITAGWSTFSFVSFHVPPGTVSAYQAIFTGTTAPNCGITDTATPMLTITGRLVGIKPILYRELTLKQGVTDYMKFYTGFTGLTALDDGQFSLLVPTGNYTLEIPASSDPDGTYDAKTVTIPQTSGLAALGDIRVTYNMRYVMGITVSADGGAKNVSQGTPLQLSAAILPAEATNKDVTWSIQSGSGATIDQSGLLTATGAAFGTVTVRTTAQDWQERYGEYVVAVNAGAPAAPLNFAVTVENRKATLTWQAPDNGGSAITDYEVSNDGGYNWTSNGTNLSRTYTGLQNGREYTFMVRAVNMVGTGAEASVKATPTAAPATYGVSIGTLSNGNVSADKADYAAGETVTLTATPDTGYELATISAHKTGDETVPVSLNGFNPPTALTGTFEMPAYGVTVTATFKLTDAAAVAAAKTALTWNVIKNANTLETAVTGNLAFPASPDANGVTITWSSSPTGIIANDGTVNRPSYTAGDASVTLTVTITKGSASDKVFNLTVTKLAQTGAEAVAAAKAALTWDVIRNANTAENAVTTALTLVTSGADGTSISWSSNNTSVIAADGTVNRPASTASDASVTLTATIKKGGVEDTKVFNLTVTKEPDTTAPTVTATSPANGATNVAVTTGTVSVTFDEAINTATGTAGLTPAGATLNSPQWSNGNKTVTYSVSGLAYGMTYTYNLSDSRDLAGNTMTAVMSGHSFTTIGKEATPNAVIDYTAEKLTGLVADATCLINNNEVSADASGKITLSESWLGQALSIIKKGNGTTTVNSDAQTLAVPARPAAPTVQGINETSAGLNNGQITGVSPAMEYRLATAGAWTPITGTTVENLAAGSYQVRLKATTSAFASSAENVTIATGAAQTRILTVTAPTFTAENYGYVRPAAKAITIANSGNSAATVSNVAASGSNFEVAGNGANVPAGGNITTWTIRPKAGLSAGTHTATITVTYNGTAGTTATAEVSFTVNAPVNAATPVITGQPQDETADEGDNVTLSVTASVSDNGTLSYQWYGKTTNGNSGGTAINGETSASYLPPTNAAGIHYYYVVVTNTNNSANGTKTASITSRAATVTVNAIAIVNAATPVITGQPQGATVNLGGNVGMSVTASVSDGGDLSYQWYGKSSSGNYGGTAISGATGSVYSPPTNATGTRYYYVEVTNTNNGVNGATTATATSNSAAVTVNAPVYTITIGGTTGGTVLASAESATAGETVTLTASPAPGYELSSISAHKTGDVSVSVSLNSFNVLNALNGNFEMPAFDVTITATFKKTQAQLDREAVEAVKAAIEGGTYRIAQATGNDAAGVKTWLVNTLNVLFGQSHGVQFRSGQPSIIGEVTITAITPAVAGTEILPDGTNGSFAFTVSLTRGATKLTAIVSTGVIVAIPHVSTPVKRIELLLIGDLTARIINTGNVATGDLTLTLSGTNADAFILPQETVNSLNTGGEANIAIAPRTDLAAGTYTATLTVSGEGITPVSVEITYMVITTGIDSPQANALKAYVQNGLLHVSDLTVGKIWSIYSISGALIYQSVAREDKADFNLSIRGVYIVTSGNKTVKVIY